MKKSILVSAYAISPYKGSEFGSAWNTIIHLAKENNLHVIYGASDDHMGETESLKSYLSQYPLHGATFFEVKPGPLALQLNRLNKMGLIWFFYIAFYYWQKRAYKTALQIVNDYDIDVVHQLGPIGYREPGFLWKLNKPMVWGPIGGTAVVSMKLLRSMPLATRIKFGIKNILNWLQFRLSYRVKKAINGSNALLAATCADQKNIRTVFKKDSFHLPDTNMNHDPLLNQNKFESIKANVDLVWSGSHIDRKNLQLCLKALSLSERNNWTLHILGSGPLTERLKKTAIHYGISDRTVWYGHVSRDKAIEVMSNAHLHIMTSVAEANSSVLFEAMSYGVPTLTLDHCGMGDVVCDSCGIKISVANPDNILPEMVSKLLMVLDNTEILKRLAFGTIECAQKYSWNNRLKIIDQAYSKAINVWANKQEKY